MKSNKRWDRHSPGSRSAASPLSGRSGSPGIRLHEQPVVGYQAGPHGAGLGTGPACAALGYRTARVLFSENPRHNDVSANASM